LVLLEPDWELQSGKLSCARLPPNLAVFFQSGFYPNLARFGQSLAALLRMARPLKLECIPSVLIARLIISPDWSHFQIEEAYWHLPDWGDFQIGLICPIAPNSRLVPLLSIRQIGIISRLLPTAPDCIKFQIDTLVLYFSFPD